MLTALQGLVRPKKLETDKGAEDACHSVFVAEPFERGFGITIGNAIRRHLLSSIQGAAVVAVKIDGIHHEFSTLDGVVEDVSEIILNVKEMIVKKTTDDSVSITLKASGKGEVTAASIEAPPSVEILNPDLHLATLTDDKASLVIEMVVEGGRGYSPAEKNGNPNWDISMIPIDATFTPVSTVSFRIEKTRVEQSSDYDKLILEVFTNGAIKPVDAVAQAAKNLKDHLQIFINFDEAQEVPTTLVNDEKMKVALNLRKSVEELELSVRSYNCLKNADIKSILELVTKTDHEMLKTRNFGRKSLNEIKDILVDMGLSLGMDIDQYKEELATLDQPAPNNQL
ncbi:DNA-directed RNA polymerase alpha subunit [hydrothermal vent metagenome]|uniref:DNA-directed RNA polymerase n=1 Tax=hydrothermal vent metagenome TaxID=652676 RepID=A0A3B1BXU1_9ZZZZ